MSRRTIDLVGKVFGRLTVQARAISRRKGAYWMCECQCGTKRVIASQALRYGLTRSCGCLRREVTAKTGRDALLALHKARKAGAASSNGKTLRLTKALEQIFPQPHDTRRVTIPGARVVRGSRY